MGARIWVRINPQIEDAYLLEKRNVRYDTSYSPREDIFETEFMAQERLLDMMSKRIVLTVFEGWHTNLKTEKELGYEKNEDSESILNENDRIIVPKELPKEQRDEMLQKIKERQNN